MGEQEQGGDFFCTPSSIEMHFISIHCLIFLTTNLNRERIKISPQIHLAGCFFFSCALQENTDFQLMLYYQKAAMLCNKQAGAPGKIGKSPISKWTESPEMESWNSLLLFPTDMVYHFKQNSFNPATLLVFTPAKINISRFLGDSSIKLTLL